MDLQQCRHCGQCFSSSAEKCPHCGRRQIVENEIPGCVWKLLWVVVAIFACILLHEYGCDREPERPREVEKFR